MTSTTPVHVDRKAGLSDDTIRSYVDWEHGLISPHLFSSQEIYELELERVFSKTWLFLAHESQLKNPNDFFTTYMGADPVIVMRQRDGSIGAFLNACRHRGMKVCRADEGNSKAFTCTYHGWTYGSDGSLAEVPHFDSVYKGGFNREEWGLIPVNRVEIYKGFIFGSFDDTIAPLDEYLGDFKYYLDIWIDSREGGVEFIPGVQKARIKGNWKIAAEQFAGDEYHAEFSHISSFSTLIPPELGKLQFGNFDHFRQVGTPNGHGGGYTLVGPPAGAAMIGGDPILDVDHRANQEEVTTRLGEERGTIYKGTIYHGNVFPNMSIISNTNTVRVWHPRGPNEMEIYSWVFVDKAASDEVKEARRWLTQQHFGPQGLAEKDDGENFVLIGNNLAGRGHQIHKMMLNYQMGLTNGGTQIPDPDVTNGSTEMPQRIFYREWARLVAPSTNGSAHE